MEIVFLGHSSFKIKGKTASIVTDPFDSEEVGLKFSETSAHIVTVSHNHSDHNKVDQISEVKKIIKGPGEYEIAGVSIIGIDSYHDDKKGEERGKNTIYVIEIDGFRIAHLGDLGHPLNESTLQDIGDIDILMIPVGGVYTIDAAGASEVAKAIEPNITLPMHYKMPGMNSSFDELSDTQNFITQMGLPVENLPKFTAREGFALDDEQKIVILEKK